MNEWARGRLHKACAILVGDMSDGTLREIFELDMAASSVGN